MKLIVRYKLVVLFMLSLVAFSCTYEKIEIADELPQNVSFQNDLIPLFNRSCNSIGCHNAGGIAPDLSAENSYKSLTTVANMIDLETPENSVFYIRMIDAQRPMPLSGVMPYESQQVLSWIKDDAQEN